MPTCQKPVGFIINPNLSHQRTAHSQTEIISSPSRVTWCVSGLKLYLFVLFCLTVYIFVHFCYDGYFYITLNVVNVLNFFRMRGEITLIKQKMSVDSNLAWGLGNSHLELGWLIQRPLTSPALLALWSRGTLVFPRWRCTDCISFPVLGFLLWALGLFCLQNLAGIPLPWSARLIGLALHMLSVTS